MSHLAFDTGLCGKLYQLPGFFHGIGQGLFYKNMFTLFDGFFAEFKMIIRGGHHINGIAGINQAVGIEKAGELVFIGDFTGCIIVGIIKTNDLGTLDFFPVI